MDRNALPLTKMLAIDKRLLQIATASCLVMASAASLRASSDWAGASGNWNSNTSPGWNGTGVPVAGTTANLGSSVAKTITLDVGNNVVGSLYFGGSGNFVTSVVLSNGLTLNNNGSASVISNTNTSSGTNNRLAISGGTLTLASDLIVSNTGNSTNSTPITFTSSATVAGTGNVTFSNVSNSVTQGAISWGSTSTFTGNILIEKGAVIYGLSGNFGNAANVITLGSSGNGSATLMATGSNATMANKIVVASGSGGKLLLGSNSAAANNTVFSGTLLLNGNVNLTSQRTGVNDTRYTGVISGDGSVTVEGNGRTQFGNASTNITNTYKGNTILTETSSLTLSDNSKLTFYIGATGVNNKITATGGGNNTLTLDGDFIFDLTGAAAVGTWQIVDVSLLSESFNQTTFGVYTSTGTPWTKTSGIWNYTSGSVTYSFSEATGALTAVPEPTTALLLGGGLMVLMLRRRRS